MQKRVVLVVFIFLLVGVGLLVYYGQYRNQRQERSYSGTIEVTEANLAFQVGGRVLSVAVKEGQAVAKDQILSVLDDAEFRARHEQAAANLERARRTKAQLETALEISRGALPADVSRAMAAAQSARDVLSDARKNDLRYAELFKRGVVTEKERDSVHLASENAARRLDEAEAVLAQARANLKKIAAAEQDIAAAGAQIAALEAALAQSAIQLGYAQLRAPCAGIVTNRAIEPGEVVNPGREVLTVADLSRVDLKIFVDETTIGKVKPGQKADVHIDTFPDHAFAGTVAYVSPEAEFTPKIIQTKKERVKLVYLVKIAIANPSLALKAGMPADAYLR